MAGHHRFDLAQRRSAAQLGKQQRYELIARLETARRRVGPVFINQFVESRPRNQFEDVMEDAIGMAHGVDPFSCPVESQNSGNK